MNDCIRPIGRTAPTPSRCDRSGNGSVGKVGVWAMGTRLIFTLTAGFLLVGAQGGWQSAFSQANPSPTATAVVVAQEKTTSAIVEDVDPQARHVLLRLPDDTLATLKV